MLKRKQQIIALVIATILLLPTISQSCIAQSANDTFSIIWISDTQYITESHPDLFTDLCRWITQNKDTYNVQMVIHTGDIVNQEGNITQWTNANYSMSLLAADAIPYCWNAGNHDYNATCWIGNQYEAFNPQTFQSKPYWLSSFEDGKNTAVCFNASGYQWLIVNLAFFANDSALAWANDLLDAYPDAHAIVATHAYINRQCKYDSWATLLKETVLDKHANVFLTLSGHHHPTSGNRTRVGGRDELLFNQQDATDQMGAASARLLTFDVASSTIRVQTYDLSTSRFLDDSDNDFTLDNTFRNEPNLTPLFCAIFAGTVSAVSAGIVFYVWRRRVRCR